MLAGLPTIVGLQMLLGFMHFDVSNVPNVPLQQRLCYDARFYPGSFSTTDVTNMKT
jgi:hypothetical protein